MTNIRSGTILKQDGSCIWDDLIEKLPVSASQLGTILKSSSKDSEELDSR